MSFRPPPTISFKVNWMKELDSEVAGSSKDTQRIQSNQTTIIKNGQTLEWTRIHHRERYLVWSRGHQALNTNGETCEWIKIHSQSCVELIKIEEENQTRTERPVGGQEATKVEELDIDFKSPRIVTCSCESSRTFLSSRARQKDRKSSSSRSTSSRLAAE